MRLSPEALEYAMKISSRLDSLELSVEEARVIKLTLNFVRDGIMELSGEVCELLQRVIRLEQKMGIPPPEPEELLSEDPPDNGSPTA